MNSTNAGDAYSAIGEKAVANEFFSCVRDESTFDMALFVSGEYWARFSIPSRADLNARDIVERKSRNITKRRTTPLNASPYFLVGFWLFFIWIPSFFVEFVAFLLAPSIPRSRFLYSSNSFFTRLYDIPRDSFICLSFLASVAYLSYIWENLSVSFPSVKAPPESSRSFNSPFAYFNELFSCSMSYCIFL